MKSYAMLIDGKAGIQDSLKAADKGFKVWSLIDSAQADGAKLAHCRPLIHIS